MQPGLLPAGACACCGGDILLPNSSIGWGWLHCSCHLMHKRLPIGSCKQQSAYWQLEWLFDWQQPEALQDGIMLTKTW